LNFFQQNSNDNSKIQNSKFKIQQNSAKLNRELLKHDRISINAIFEL